MEILERNQYNLNIGKYKVLSSTAGVGSLVTTKNGYTILISDICKWNFIKTIQKRIKSYKEEGYSSEKIYNDAKIGIVNDGLHFVDDERFVEFLQIEKQLTNLVCLVNIPEMSLNDVFNTPDWTHHPIRSMQPNARAETYMIQGTHFPKWFKNKKGELKTYSEWKRMWPNKEMNNFVPPRDFSSPIIRNGKHIKIGEVELYEQLSQLNLILICPNGHLSDIPWSKYLRWKKERKGQEGNGEYLFKLDDCCTSPSLEWTENTNKSEGYSSIYLECTNCKTKTNLEGINSIKPYCHGQKPWEIDLGQDTNEFIPYEDCKKINRSENEREKMQVSLVTGNNTYYADGFSSLYIPRDLANNISAVVLSACDELTKKFLKRISKNSALTKIEYWKNLDKEDFVCDYNVDDEDSFIHDLENEFVGVNEDIFIDRYEEYRYQEFRCFSKHKSLEREGLICKDIDMPISLENYFTKIVQVEDLREIRVQLDFTRKEPKQRFVVENKIIEFTKGKNIFSVIENELYVLPANEVSGEGIFFQFRDDMIEKWVEDNKENLEKRYFKLFKEQPDLKSQGANIKYTIYNNGFKHFVIHTFSHLLMREFEFSCGYPTASLKERLYISERMTGVLIYTAAGAEGSMGGLVWQGQPDKIESLVIKAMNRAVDCSSDPICWESEGQGIFDLNLASCFSCTLVSETACEQMNLGLDRRALVDEKIGFFKNLLE